MGKTLQYFEGDDKGFLFTVSEQDFEAGTPKAARDITNDTIYFNVWDPSVLGTTASTPLVIKDNDSITPGVEVGITLVTPLSGILKVDLIRADLLANAIIAGSLMVKLEWGLMVRKNHSTTDEPVTVDSGVFELFRRRIETT